MQKQTSIYIPKPCHEDWNKMTPTQQGKFCSACNKQVVDFSLMSDKQVLNFLSTQSGKLCGRFDADQLQRPLIETKIKKKKSWWMALTMPLLFLFERSEAQENKVIIDSGYYEMDTTVLIGAVARIEPNKKINITGKVVDENNEPLAYASVVQKGTLHGIACDSSGNFSININKDANNVLLSFSSVGYETSMQKIMLNSDTLNLTVKLKPTVQGEVVVTGYAYTRSKGLMSMITRVTTFEKIDSSFKKLIGISNVYPNPSPRGSLVHLKIKSAGNYQMQLLDNQSRLIQAEEINTGTSNSTTQIQLASNIAAGIYYLRLIDEQKKKSYTEKLIVQ